MRRVVLHPSAFVSWVGPGPAPLRAEFEGGQLEVLAPRVFVGEATQAFAAKGWTAGKLEQLASAIDAMGVRLEDPPAAELAAWLVRGLSASDAAYAALASWHDLPLAVSSDQLRAATAILPHEPE